jgi:hypothetical protein
MIHLPDCFHQVLPAYVEDDGHPKRFRRVSVEFLEQLVEVPFVDDFVFVQLQRVVVAVTRKQEKKKSPWSCVMPESSDSIVDPFECSVTTQEQIDENAAELLELLE